MYRTVEDSRFVRRVDCRSPCSPDPARRRRQSQGARPPPTPFLSAGPCCAAWRSCGPTAAPSSRAAGHYRPRDTHVSVLLEYLTERGCAKRGAVTCPQLVAVHGIGPAPVDGIARRHGIFRWRLAAPRAVVLGLAGDGRHSALARGRGAHPLAGCPFPSRVRRLARVELAPVRIAGPYRDVKLAGAGPGSEAAMCQADAWPLG